MNILQSINNHDDLLELSDKQLRELCEEIRSFLVESLSDTGGHLASNLGAVELSVMLHRVYDPRRDRLLFDVGHQCYTHKILTGRMASFGTLRRLDGLSGFPDPTESECDPFIAGHASNSVSAALGMARARTLLDETYDVVAVIGDGALSGGLAYEGLSDAGESGEPLVVVLNDNGMSIQPNVGGVARLLSRMRVKPAYISFKQVFRRVVGVIPPLYRMAHNFKEWLKLRLLPSNMFDDMGFQYIGPVDGHDLTHLEILLRWARDLRKPVLLHVVTQKGKGCEFAEKSPDAYHGVGAYDPVTGEIKASGKSFSDCMGEELSRLAQEDSRICAVSAAMEDGTGLHSFAREIPARFFDVGIAEGHAVTMAAGLAKQGLLPVFAVYSCFLPRACDMLYNDVGLQNLHVVFCVDRAGLVGRDGETHHGMFDVAHLSAVPGMTIYCPSNFSELRDMLSRALYKETGPVTVRYPRGGEGPYLASHADEDVTILQKGNDITLISYGLLINELLDAAAELSAHGISADVIKLNRICPLNNETVLQSLKKTRRLIVLEDVCQSGCVGEKILADCAGHSITLRAVRLLNAGDGIVRHGEVCELRAALGLNTSGVVSAALSMLNETE
ncbi:MAG: 1-deoxy-D-xylulose-5-phosphate synthase [Eubacteriales bacterium]|nr:1-deoxy-D-xylulose-5-phosphate synthase [Eubacteriales bacterium]